MIYVKTSQFNWQEFHPQGKEYIEKLITDIFTNYLVSISGWWYNINLKGSWNTPHSHGGSNYALVWYLTDSNGLLRLMDPFPQRHNSEHMTVHGKKGSIVIFPSDLIHYVKPNPKDEDRISISMNLQLC